MLGWGQHQFGPGDSFRQDISMSRRLASRGSRVGRAKVWGGVEVRGAVGHQESMSPSCQAPETGGGGPET